MNPIKITTVNTDEPLLGKSKWWGAPDLPASVPFPYTTYIDEDGEEYPQPLTFICQIRLRDIADIDTDNLLPHTGMLYFFADIDYFLGEDAPLVMPLHNYSGDMIRVMYIDQESDLEPYDITWEGTDESIFRKAEAICFNTSDAEFCHEFLSEPFEDEVRDKYPNHISLLSIHEDERWNLRFFDCGTMYFLIDKEDLKQGDFTQVKSEVFFY